MARMGKVVGVAVSVLVAAALSSLGTGPDASVADGEEWVSSSGVSASDHAISNAYTGALFGSECLARF